MIRIIMLSLSLFLSPVDRTKDSWTTEDLDIYTAVLRFFTPPQNQVRWIGLEMIPDGHESVPTAMRDSLITRLGRRFEGWSVYHESDPRSGGRINLSSIYRYTPDSVGVTAQYQHHTEYHENSPFNVRFIIVKRSSKWVLLKP